MQSLLYILNNENDTRQLAARIAAIVQPPCVLFLSGDIGVGKTTFVRHFLKAKGVNAPVKSPTYTIVESYPLKNNHVAHHFDFYRLFDESMLDDIGFRDYFSPDAICLIEWPTNAPLYAHISHIEMTFTLKNEGRECVILANNPEGTALLTQIGTFA